MCRGNSSPGQKAIQACGMGFCLLVPCFSFHMHCLHTVSLFCISSPVFFGSWCQNLFASFRYDCSGKELASLVDHGRTQGCRGGPGDGLTILHVGQQERVSAILLKLLKLLVPSILLMRRSWLDSCRRYFCTIKWKSNVHSIEYDKCI